MSEGGTHIALTVPPFVTQNVTSIAADSDDPKNGGSKPEADQ